MSCRRQSSFRESHRKVTYNAFISTRVGFGAVDVGLSLVEGMKVLKAVVEAARLSNACHADVRCRSRAGHLVW